MYKRRWKPKCKVTLPPRSGTCRGQLFLSIEKRVFRSLDVLEPRLKVLLSLLDDTLQPGVLRSKAGTCCAHSEVFSFPLSTQIAEPSTKALSFITVQNMRLDTGRVDTLYTGTLSSALICNPNQVAVTCYQALQPQSEKCSGRQTW